MSEIKQRKINSVKCIKIHTPWHCNSTLSVINHAWMYCMCVCVSHSLSLCLRMVRLDWSHPGRPNGIMLGYEVLRRTLRSCANGPTGATTSVEEESEGAVGLRFRCSYLQCPASHGVCGTSCFSPDIQVIKFWTFSTYCICPTFSLFLHWSILGGNISSLFCSALLCSAFHLSSSKILSPLTFSPGYKNLF